MSHGLSLRGGRRPGIPGGSIGDAIARVRDAIARGELKPGDVAPSVRRLARDSCVSLGTANAALRRLADLGLLRALPEHRGYLVLELDNAARAAAVDAEVRELYAKLRDRGFTSEEIIAALPRIFASLRA